MEARPTESVLVVAGGTEWSGPLPRFDAAIRRVIAADSGAELAMQLGLPCSVIIGDLDSVSPETLAEAERLGAEVDRYPADKDATDLELALDRACSEGASEIVIIGGAGGRASHLLGNATLVASAKYAAVKIRWLLPGAEIHIVHGGKAADIEGDPEDFVSLIPMGGAVTGITTAGLKWALEGEQLAPGTSRGISNELVASSSTISIDSGILLVVHERHQ